MDFKFNSSIFKNTVEDHKRIYGENYDPEKPYPVFTGVGFITKAQCYELAEYLRAALETELKYDEYLQDVVVPIKISGWQKESKNGKKFLSLAYAPDYKTLTAARDWKESQEIQSHQAQLDESAANLAKATNGAVVQTQQDDIF